MIGKTASSGFSFLLLAGLIACGSSSTTKPKSDPSGDYTANLTGAEETPPVTTTATGKAMMTLKTDDVTLTYTVTHNVANVTAAHIHKGAKGVMGGVVRPLAMTDAMTFSGTLTITATIASDLAAGNLYVNIHSKANPGGEIRAQLQPAASD